MGLTSHSTGAYAIDSEFIIQKQSPADKVIALAGNPNVGKSTIFNSLTGMKQHTGNWPGKTVANAQGRYTAHGQSCILVDIPGTYSLAAHSAEEEVARNYLCFGSPDAVAVVCDASCLERNLNLVLQTMGISSRVVVCINLMDEAEKKGIRIYPERLAQKLGVPVVTTVGRDKKSLPALTEALNTVIESRPEPQNPVLYPAPIEEALSLLVPVLQEKAQEKMNPRWLALRLLDADDSLTAGISSFLGPAFLEDPALGNALDQALDLLASRGIDPENFRDMVTSALIRRAETLCTDVVQYTQAPEQFRDWKLDRILTGRLWAYPVMILLLAFLLWLTIAGANYPSQVLSGLLFGLQDVLTALFHRLHAPEWLHSMLVPGIYRVVAWVVSVMLPPMAIFFPLFTLLEDVGYLPRLAYNLDRPFQCCRACGKQALCMAMGFGCNAAGVTGCRIIDSPRERLLAILTNSFVPCNGRFPTLIALIAIFFTGADGSITASLLSALLLTFTILLGIGMTFAVTRLLSATWLKGVPSAYTLELPPYRKPQIGSVLVRSVFDRTLFVLGRAAAVAVPAGFLIWCMANLHILDTSLLSWCASFLDPFARLMGLDGVILMAFLLGFPANEIVMPIIFMAYLSQGTLTEMSSLASMKLLLISHGWTFRTAVSMILFSLFHWPCSTTLLTIHRETRSLRWTLLAALLPTAAGVALCMLSTGIFHIFSPAV